MSDRDEVYMQHLLTACRDSVRRAEESEVTYRARVGEHIARAETVPGRSKADAEYRASSDAIVTAAARAGALNRDWAQTYALAFLAEVFSVEIEGEPT